MNKFIILFAIAISFATEKLIPVETLLIDCHEPSDITFDVSDNSFVARNWISQSAGPIAFRRIKAGDPIWTISP